MDKNCASCTQQVDTEWNYCANCGVKIQISSEVFNNKDTENHTKRITERFLLLANDYRALTGHVLEGEVLQSFVNHPASGTLSVINADKRMQAGRKCRISLGGGKFSLDLTHWLEAVYELHEAPFQSRVWITQGGTKYHTNRECSGITGGQEYARWKGKDTYNPQFIEIRRASFVLGLSPCLVCKPPVYRNNKI